MKVSPTSTGWYPPSTYSEGSSWYSSSALIGSLTAVTSVNNRECCINAIAIVNFHPSYRLVVNDMFLYSVNPFHLLFENFEFMWQCPLSKRLMRSYTSRFYISTFCSRLPIRAIWLDGTLASSDNSTTPLIFTKFEYCNIQTQTLECFLDLCVCFTTQHCGEWCISNS